MKILGVKRGTVSLLGAAAVLLCLLALLTWIASISSQERENENLSKGENLTNSAQKELTNKDVNGEETTSITPVTIVPSLPFTLSDTTAITNYQCSQTLESWQLLSSKSCADYALSVLEDLRTQDLELVKAGFMDISGESWGCVFIGAQGQSLAVTLIPERPFSSRSDKNLLVVSMLHYFESVEFT